MGLTPGRQLEGAAAAAPLPAARPRLLARLSQPGLLSFAILLALLAVWELAGHHGYVNAFFFSWPSAIGVAVWKMLVDGELFANLWMTVYA